MHSIVRGLGAAALCAVIAAPAAAQSRPLVTEDPETVPAGFILIEASLDYLQGAVYPTSGLRGNLTRVGTFGLSFGVSSIAEIQVDGGLRSRLGIKTQDLTAPLAGLYTGTGTSTAGFEDLTVGAKIRFISETETRPAFAVRFATRLPWATASSGLGTDTFDFLAGLSAAKTVQSVRVAANLGMGILGDAVEGHQQNRVVTYGVSAARAIATGVELVGELNGRLDTGEEPPPVGTGSRGAFRLGGRVTRGPVRIDGAFLLGLTDVDPSWGVSVGATWVFKGFDVR